MTFAGMEMREAPGGPGRMNNQTPDANGLPPHQGQGGSLLAAAEGIMGLLYSPAA